MVVEDKQMAIESNGKEIDDEERSESDSYSDESVGDMIDKMDAITAAQLMDKTRNKTMYKVVTDNRQGKNQVIGESDDLIVIYDVDVNEDTVYGKWETDKYAEGRDATTVLKRWKAVTSMDHKIERCFDAFYVRRDELRCRLFRTTKM